MKTTMVFEKRGEMVFLVFEGDIIVKSWNGDFTQRKAENIIKKLKKESPYKDFEFKFNF